jgi:hypothetical protein
LFLEHEWCLTAYKNGAKASYGGLIRGAKGKWLSSFSKNFKNVELNIDSKVVVFVVNNICPGQIIVPFDLVYFRLFYLIKKLG